MSAIGEISPAPRSPRHAVSSTPRRCGCPGRDDRASVRRGGRRAADTGSGNAPLSSCQSGARRHHRRRRIRSTASPSSATAAPPKCMRSATMWTERRLHSVYLDHVILDRDGTLETCAAATARRQRAAPVRRRTAPTRVRPRRSTTCAAWSPRPGLSIRSCGPSPSYDNAAGKLRGFRAYPGPQPRHFQQLGLRPGDLVTAINGTAAR